MPVESKLTDDQRAEIARRFVAGEKQTTLAAEFSICTATVHKVCAQLNAVRPPILTTIKKDLAEFEHRVKSILWRQDHGAEKPTYNAWKLRVDSLTSADGGNYSKDQAIVRASKEYECLHRLFREYDVSEFDPNPESHPTIQYFGQPAPTESVICEGKEQSYRESLRWAMDAAGAFMRTGQQPATCPCDTAWYLYTQARLEPKDFLSRVGQIESKGDSDPGKGLRKSGQRSIAEIDGMLAELNSGEEENA